MDIKPCWNWLKRNKSGKRGGLFYFFYNLSNKMKRALICILIICLVPPALFGYLLLVQKLELAKQYDIQYIAKHCPNAAVVGHDIDAHISYDGGFFQTYIFDQILGKSSNGDFEAAYRDSFTEVSCIPFLGCLIPPSLQKGCYG